MYYVGQLVVLKEENDIIGVFTGTDEKDDDFGWVFCFNPVDEEYDIYAFAKKDFGYLKEPSKTTLSGEQIYYGPFCKFKFQGSIPDKVVEKMRPEFIKELKSQTKKQNKK